MRAAQRSAEADPRITAWAELAVLGHLTGWPMPEPAPQFAAELSSLDPRLRDCTLSHAVDAAVAARTPLISARVSAPALAGHVTAAMTRLLGGDRQAARQSCDGQEAEYLAPAYRWALVLDSLRARNRLDPAADRDPRSAEWLASYGRPIPGATTAAQLGAVQRWYDADLRDPDTARAIAFGVRTPAAIETAIGAQAGREDWDQRLAELLTEFSDCRWPADFLRPLGTR
jgi:hypothetical protein